MSWRIPLPTWYGWGLLLPVVPLCAAGVLTIEVTSGSASTGGLSGPSIKQLTFIGAGLVAAGVVMAVGYQRVGRFSDVLFALCIGMLMYLLIEPLTGLDVPLVKVQRHARRWIRLGPSSGPEGSMDREVT